jgi:two-component system CheB/CheR fusion protein
MDGSTTTPLCVLVVDDNVDTALSLAMIFRACGHEVRVAHDGPAALETAQDFRPDAVVLDIALPGMDGFEVARQLRASPELGGAQVLALSGYNRPADRAAAAEAGIESYLVKPVDPWHLGRLLTARTRLAQAAN